jgi:hypothetical protein
MKNTFRLLLPLALSSFLFSCGGSSEATDDSAAPVIVPIVITPVIPIVNPPVVVETFSIQTVPSLDKAIVCVDLNANLICEDDEELGITNDNGKFDVEVIYQSNNLLVKAVVNQTIDLLSGFGVGQSYVLSSSGPVTYISPISTLLVGSSYTVEELSSSWGIPLSVLSGDYVDLATTGNLDYAYVVLAASRLLVSELKDGGSINNLVEPISVAMADVLVALTLNVDLTDLIFEKEQNGLIVTNLEKPLIEYVDFSNMTGDWSFSHFGGIEGDRYGDISINANSISDNYCVRDAELDSNIEFSPTSVRDCVTLSFNDGLMLPGYDDELMLVYGHKSSVGTVLIFKAKHWQGVNKLDDGYYWFDDFEDSPLVGRSLSQDQWVSQSMSLLGYTPDGLWEGFSLDVSASDGVSVIYNGKTDTVSSWVFLEQLNLSNAIEMFGKSISYDDINYSNHQERSVYRHGDLMGLSISSDNGVRSFSLISPNDLLIDNIGSGLLSTGVVLEFETF